MCNEESFLKDVKDHEMIVVRDDGLYRHITFKRPGTNCYRFDLVTWPGYLAYTGDMGSYVFSRLPDMFEFFRTDREYDKGDGLAINLSYWGEKLEAVDTVAGYRKWSREKFKERASEHFEEWLDNEGLDEDDIQKAREDFEYDVLDRLAVGGANHAYTIMRDFAFDGEYPFQDFWEVNTEEYTYNYLWCCYALAYGIQQYDLTKEKENENLHC